MRWVVTITLLLGMLCALPAQAQTEQADKDRITRYLEDTLSGLGREIRIEGFRGTLSSRVSMSKLTIADADGIWLTLDDAVLDWSRLKVLRGEIVIDQISAKRIALTRWPAGEAETSPEAGSFSLPELPVSIDIKLIKADLVELGEPIIGAATKLTVTGALSLINGQGAADLAIKRLDGPRGAFSLATAYANASRILSLDLTLDEAKDGIAANLLGLPGRPALQLIAKGNAPIDDFIADVVLKSDGQERLTGQISTKTEGPEDPDVKVVQAQPRVITADISGDLTPLFAPEYRRFFGSDVALKSLIRLFPDGRISLENLNIHAAALSLEGNADLSADGLPDNFRLNAVLEDPDQKLVLLPLNGPKTWVRRAAISARFDRDQGDAWLLRADLQGFERPDVTLDDLQLSAEGVIRNGEAGQVTARINGVAKGIALADAALARALGDTVELRGNLAWREGQPLQVSKLALSARGLTMTGAGTVDGLDSAITVDGMATAEVEDLSRFADLAGQPLAGRMSADLKGQAALLTGAFDLDLNAIATNLGIGIRQIDAALTGDSQLQVSALRDETGLTLRTSKIVTRAGAFEATGLLVTGQSNIEYKVALDDLGRFVAGLNGPARFSGDLSEHDTGWLTDVVGAGPLSTTVKARLALPDNASPSVKLTATIGTLGALIPDLPGLAQVTATARQNGERWNVDASGIGPGGSTFAAAGQIRQDASAAQMDLNGTLPLGLLNRRLSPNAMQGTAQFDLRLDGPLALASLSGKLSTSGARLSLPNLRNALTGINATIDLSGRNAAINTTAAIATGGQMSAQGRIGMQAPYVTDMVIQLQDVTIRDPDLYETMARAKLNLTGTLPDTLRLTGGVTLDRTEVRVPTTDVSSTGAIPDISHVNEPAAVRRTRGYAGLLDNGAKGGSAGSSGSAIGLDVLLAADSRVFVRGRGLDAELGGRLRLTGTTNDVIPIGNFGLVRGRLNILGKRLDLQEGTISMQGDFVPYLRLVASTTSDDGTDISVVVEGPADAPEISFVSDPELPSDEVLARLLFGREITQLSALQALQLASAVATLAGKGGIGIVESIRENTGLDDLDISNDGEGGTTVGVGKYISDNVYTDVVIGNKNESQINLNIDLSRRTTVRGQLKSDGSTGIGIFFEKDY